MTYIRIRCDGSGFVAQLVSGVVVVLPIRTHAPRSEALPGVGTANALLSRGGVSRRGCARTEAA